ncbi:MAG: phosphate propanoyltransferase [Patescibacteria group bacterium]|jgi:putative phosphotransacetylase
MKTIIAEISARHIHLSQKDVDKLFGKNYALKKLKELSQPHQFATLETLSIIGKRNSFSKVRIIGPIRSKTQVELSVTDCYYLGIKPSVQISGQVKNSSRVIIKGPRGQVTAPAIVAMRHLHLSERQAKAWNYKHGKKISVLIKGDRSVILNNVVVRIGDYDTRLQLDTDEGNAVGLVNNQKVYIYE